MPSQMYDHFLNPTRGWPDIKSLTTIGKKSTALLYELRAGQCVHKNSSGRFEPGVQLAQMPLFIFQGSLDKDVANEGGSQWTGIIPVGNIMAIVGNAAMELETTEYVKTLTYAYNEPLRSPTGLTANDEGLSNGVPTTASSGVLRNDSVTIGTQAVVGFVSKGVVTNYNTAMLNFWPQHTPGTV